ncbi:MAG: hypothetical protein ACE5GI_05660 [Candidatus Aminicenantales bacterium]
MRRGVENLKLKVESEKVKVGCLVIGLAIDISGETVIPNGPFIIGL